MSVVEGWGEVFGGKLDGAQESSPPEVELSRRREPMLKAEEPGLHGGRLVQVLK